MRRSIFAVALFAALVVLLRKLLQDAGSRVPSAVAPASRESHEVTNLEDLSREQLYRLAKELQISGRSKMTKDGLAQAIGERNGEDARRSRS